MPSVHLGPRLTLYHRDGHLTSEQVAIHPTRGGSDHCLPLPFVVQQDDVV